MKLNEAIDGIEEIKRRAMTWNHQVILDEEDIEALDTVVSELEKPLPTDDEIEESTFFMSVAPNIFANGAKWMRDLIERRAK